MSWQLASFVVVAVALGAGFAWYERTRPSSRVLALVATLVAMAVLGRLAFAPLPNVKPATTDVILFAGFVLGAAPGFVTGAITALVSNFFISQGSWTPWQMVAWGLVGIGGAALARVAGRELGRWPLAIACALAGLGFGAVMNTYQLTFAATPDMASWIAISGQSLPYDLAHAIGNFVFCLALGPAFIRAIARYRRRFDVRWAAPAAVAPVVIGLVCFAALAAPGSASASTASRAVGYLTGAQNGDGGFGAAPGASSNAMYTGWAGLGLAAGGLDPSTVRRGGPSVLDYVRSSAASGGDLGDIERTILLARASGSSPRSFGGRDLVAAVLGHRRGDGSFDESINLTAFAILAMRAAGGASLDASAGWLANQQNGDGGFGPDPHSTSDVDDTGAVLEALAAAGHGGDPHVGRAIGYITGAQNGDGGVGQYAGYESNAQSSAWAVQGLVAVGHNPDSVQRGGHTPLGFIASLQQGDGSIRYSRSSSQTPVFVTAQAIAALERKAFPLPAPRSGGGGSGASGGGSKSSAAKGSGGRGSTTEGTGAASGAGGVLGARRNAPRAGGTTALRRAAQPVGSSGGLPSASVILVIAGATLLLVGLGGVWRTQRRLAP